MFILENRKQITANVIRNEKVAENRKLRGLENQKVGGSKTCQPSYSSPSYCLIFQNICVYQCLL